MLTIYNLTVFENSSSVKKGTEAASFSQWHDEHVLCTDIEPIHYFTLLLAITSDWYNRWGLKCFWRLVISEYKHKSPGHHYTVSNIWTKITCWICNIHMLTLVLPLQLGQNICFSWWLSQNSSIIVYNCLHSLKQSDSCTLRLHISVSSHLAGKAYLRWQLELMLEWQG